MKWRSMSQDGYYGEQNPQEEIALSWRKLLMITEFAFDLWNEIWLIGDGWKPTHLCCRIFERVFREKKKSFGKHLEHHTNSSQYDILHTSTNVDRLQWLVLSTLLSSFVTEKKLDNKFRLCTYYSAIIYIQSSKNKLPYNNKRHNSASRSKLYLKKTSYSGNTVDGRNPAHQLIW